ncbi:uncharacterized protein LOC110445875 isoform X2 [Mizuhopecten yessoensis]|nr:uncharacterized protein LOC110445875 isoform X2 [Mizuhopecten yessoensis]
MMIVMICFVCVVNAGENCRKTGHVLRCDRYDAEVIQQATVEVVYLGYCPLIQFFPNLGHVINRLIIERTPMTCNSFHHQTDTVIFLNGKQCQKSTVASRHQTNPSSPMTTSSVAVETIIVTMILLIVLKIVILSIGGNQETIDPPGVAPPPLRRSTRTRRTPVRYASHE